MLVTITFMARWHSMIPHHTSYSVFALLWGMMYDSESYIKLCMMYDSESYIIPPDRSMIPVSQSYYASMIPKTQSYLEVWFQKPTHTIQTLSAPVRGSSRVWLRGSIENLESYSEVWSGNWNHTLRYDRESGIIPRSKVWCMIWNHRSYIVWCMIRNHTLNCMMYDSESYYASVP